jgi:hypothetical protein
MLFVVRRGGFEMTFTAGEKVLAQEMAAKYGTVAVCHRYYKSYPKGSRVVVGLVPAPVVAKRRRAA